MKELIDLTEVLVASADPVKTAIALLAFSVGRAAIRQSERHLEHRRARQHVQDFASLRGPVRRDLIRLRSDEPQD
jgi:hypothetical protein